MLNRRKAMKMLAGGAAALSFVSATSAMASIRKEGKKHLAMVIDLRRCNGCKACVVSCGTENGNDPQEHRTRVIQTSSNVGDKTFVLNLPLLCNHCEQPSCTRVCPTGATYKRKEDGIVVVDSTKCVGCSYCINACPYGGVRFINSKTGTVDKCNFCIQRTSQGLLPACVETCTGNARLFGDMNDPDSTVSKLLEKHDAVVLHAAKNTRPNVFYIGLSQEESNQTYSMHSEIKWQR